MSTTRYWDAPRSNLIPGSGGNRPGPETEHICTFFSAASNRLWNPKPFYSFPHCECGVPVLKQHTPFVLLFLLMPLVPFFTTIAQCTTLHHTTPNHIASHHITSHGTRDTSAYRTTPPSDSMAPCKCLPRSAHSTPLPSPPQTRKIRWITNTIFRH